MRATVFVSHVLIPHIAYSIKFHKYYKINKELLIIMLFYEM